MPGYATNGKELMENLESSRERENASQVIAGEEIAEKDGRDFLLN